MTDGKFMTAGYAILIKHHSNQIDVSVKNSYVPVAYGLKTFKTSQIVHIWKNNPCYSLPLQGTWT